MACMALVRRGNRKGKARIGLHAVGIDRDHGNLRHARFFKGTADKSNIVGSPASASCLAHENCRVIEVIFAGKKGIHDLADDDEGGVAGVIVHVLQSDIHGIAVVVLKNLHLIAKARIAGSKRSKWMGDIWGHRMV